jgi:UMP-CMP kinase
MTGLLERLFLTAPEDHESFIVSYLAEEALLTSSDAAVAALDLKRRYEDLVRRKEEEEARRSLLEARRKDLESILTKKRKDAEERRNAQKALRKAEIQAAAALEAEAQATLEAEEAKLKAEAAAAAAEAEANKLKAAAEEAQAALEEAKVVSGEEEKEVVASEECEFQVVFVLGGPGSGKGTQCARIVNSFGYAHLSAGDLLRAERKRGGELSDMINTYIKEGKIVPAEVTIGLLLKAMEESTGATKQFLIDGFPRDPANYEGWETVVGKRASVEFVLFFDCPEEVLESRLLKRGETSGRSDDNMESIRKRFATFRDESVPVAERFELAGKLRRISSAPPPDEVWEAVRSHFESTEVVSLSSSATVTDVVLGASPPPAAPAPAKEDEAEAEKEEIG